MIVIAHVRHFKGADLNPVKVFLLLRKSLAVRDLDRELAAATFPYQFGDFFNTCCEGARLAPGRKSPFDLRSIDNLRERGR